MTQELLSRIDIIALNENQDTGTFVFSPLDRGYGQTIGNSLRRTGHPGRGALDRRAVLEIIDAANHPERT